MIENNLETITEVLDEVEKSEETEFVYLEEKILNEKKVITLKNEENEKQLDDGWNESETLFGPVFYKYELNEVSFLLHKLNQLVKQRRNIITQRRLEEEWIIKTPEDVEEVDEYFRRNSTYLENKIEAISIEFLKRLEEHERELR